MNTSRILRRGPLAAVIAAAVTVVMAAPAFAAETTLNLACQANAPVVGPQKTTISQPVDVAAPATVTSGQKFDIVVTPGPTTVPTSVNGITIKNIHDVALTLPVPANATLDGAEISGGQNLNSTPTITSSATKSVVAFAGPVKGGSTFTLPTVTAHLTAGPSGSTIVSKLGGTGYDNPDLTFTTTGNVGFDIDAPTSCYASPSPALATTNVQ